MQLVQRTSPFWWTRNLASIIYFLRELTGVFIALYVMIFVGASAILGPESGFIDGQWFSIVSLVGLCAAIFHSVTWMWVSVKIFPIPLPKFLQIILFVLLLFITAVISYFLLGFFYFK